jgi:hypothetical protein
MGSTPYRIAGNRMLGPNWFYEIYQPSSLEILFDKFLRRYFPDEILSCQKRITLENGREKYTDFYWKEQDIHIELDGHEKFKRQYLGDFFNRQNLLTLENIRLIRFTWSNVQELKDVTLRDKYMVQVFNKIKDGKLASDLHFRDTDPFDKPYRRLLSRMKAEGKCEAIASFSSFFEKHIGFPIEYIFTRNAHLTVEAFPYFAPFIYISETHQVILDPLSITDLTDLDYFLKRQNYVVLAGFKL